MYRRYDIKTEGRLQFRSDQTQFRHAGTTWDDKKGEFQGRDTTILVSISARCTTQVLHNVPTRWHENGTILCPFHEPKGRGRTLWRKPWRSQESYEVTTKEVPDEDDRKIIRKSQIDEYRKRKATYQENKGKNTQSLSDNVQTL